MFCILYTTWTGLRRPIRTYYFEPCADVMCMCGAFFLRRLGLSASVSSYK